MTTNSAGSGDPGKLDPSLLKFFQDFQQGKPVQQEKKSSVSNTGISGTAAPPHTHEEQETEQVAGHVIPDASKQFKTSWEKARASKPPPAPAPPSTTPSPPATTWEKVKASKPPPAPEGPNAQDRSSKLKTISKLWGSLHRKPLEEKPIQISRVRSPVTEKSTELTKKLEAYSSALNDVRGTNRKLILKEKEVKGPSGEVKKQIDIGSDWRSFGFRRGASKSTKLLLKDLKEMSMGVQNSRDPKLIMKYTSVVDEITGTKWGKELAEKNKDMKDIVRDSNFLKELTKDLSTFKQLNTGSLEGKTREELIGLKKSLQENAPKGGGLHVAHQAYIEKIDHQLELVDSKDLSSFLVGTGIPPETRHLVIESAGTMLEGTDYIPAYKEAIEQIKTLRQHNPDQAQDQLHQLLGASIRITQLLREDQLNQPETAAPKGDEAPSTLKDQLRALQELAATNVNPQIQKTSLLLEAEMKKDHTIAKPSSTKTEAAEPAEAAEAAAPNAQAVPAFTETLGRVARGEMSEQEYKDLLNDLVHDFREESASAFLAVDGRELHKQAWSKKKEYAPNALAYIHSFNDLNIKVQASIMSAKTPEETKRLINFYLDLCDQCTENKNYNAGLAIFSALNASGTLRIIKSDPDVIQGDQKEKYDRLNEFYSSNLSYKMLREVTSEDIQRGDPVIPYFGMYLSDLTFSDDGNKDQENGKLNLTKTKGLLGPVAILTSAQKNLGKGAKRVRFAEDQPAQPLHKTEFFGGYQPEVEQNEEAVYERSLKLFPRKGSSPPTVKEGV